MALKIIVAVLAVILVFMWVITPAKTNPSDSGLIESPPEIQTILKRSCFDCHSNHTAWPWYSYVPPLSYFVVNHVVEGREHFNFSEWTTYSSKKQADLLEECVEEIEKGKMPLKPYLLTHSDAKMTANNIQLIKTWISGVINQSSEPKEQHSDDPEEGHEDHDH